MNMQLKKGQKLCSIALLKIGTQCVHVASHLKHMMRYSAYINLWSTGVKLKLLIQKV